MLYRQVGQLSWQSTTMARRRCSLMSLLDGKVAFITGVAQFPLFRPDLENPTLEDCKPAFASMMPMGEPWVEPEDISNVLVFLADDNARYMTGTVIPVDQGSNN